jgi:hypothetical protein
LFEAGATIQEVAGSIPYVTDLFNLRNPSSRFMILGLSKPLTEISARKYPGNKARSAHKADNITAICEPIL